MDALSTPFTALATMTKSSVLGYQSAFGQMGAGVGTGLASGVGSASMAAADAQLQAAQTQRVTPPPQADTQMVLRQAGEQMYAKALQFAMAREAEVVAHENAHKSALGGHGGGINFGYSQMQVPMGNGQPPRTIRYINSGNVPVNVPGLPRFGAPKTQQQAKTQASMLSQLAQTFKTIAFAAAAPHSPSGQDQAVFASAQKKSAAVEQQMSQLQQVKQQQFSSGQKAERQNNAKQVGSRLDIQG